MKNEIIGNGQSYAIEKIGVNLPTGAIASRATLSPSEGDHEPRSGGQLWGNKLVAGLGSPWDMVRGHFTASALAWGASRAWVLIAALALPLAGCVATPHTTIRGALNGSPFVIQAPKDGDLTGFDLTADTNGTVRLHIDHLAVKMNPDVIGQSGAAQTAMIQAAGETAANITAAAVAAALKSK